VKRRWPHVAFWLCFGLVLVNVGVICVAPLPELRVNALGNAWLCAIGALVFWARTAP
jgi:hypothetical protein